MSTKTKFKQAKKIDVRQEVTDKIIKLMESGKKPWQCPWVKTGEKVVSGYPYNWSTKDQYNGINIILLWIAAMENGYQTSAFLTYNQAKALGGQVRKGEKGTHCIFYKPIETEKENSTTGEKETVFLPMLKPFTVFNVEQIEGLDLPAISEQEQPEYPESEVVAKIDALAEIYCNNTGLRIKHGGDRAYFSPSLNMIRLPTTFVSGYSYAAVYSHELIHSSGSHNLLNRFTRQAEDFKSFKEAYAFEELIADIGATFLCAELGIEPDYQNHANYLSSWLEKLKNDKNFIFKAAAQASKATDLILKGGIMVKKQSDIAA